MDKALRPVMLQLLLLIDVVMLTSTQRDSVQVVSFRKSRKIRNGPGMCALDMANKTVASSSLTTCSLDCTRDAACAAFNMKNSDTICELYNCRPKVIAPVSKCENYQVSFSTVIREIFTLMPSQFRNSLLYTPLLTDTFNDAYCQCHCTSAGLHIIGIKY